MIEREWEAPIELVWELWTTPEGRGSWFGPKGFQVEVTAFELRVGGSFAYTMTATDPGMVAMMEKKGRPASFGVEATITAVETNRHLAWEAPHGPETLSTSVTFTEEDGRVKMVLVLDATKPDMTGGAAMGWKSSLSRFEERLGA